MDCGACLWCSLFWVGQRSLLRKSRPKIRPWMTIRQELKCQWPPPLDWIRQQALFAQARACPSWWQSEGPIVWSDRWVSSSPICLVDIWVYHFFKTFSRHWNCTNRTSKFSELTTRVRLLISVWEDKRIYMWKCMLQSPNQAPVCAILIRHFFVQRPITRLYHTILKCNHNVEVLSTGIAWDCENAYAMPNPVFWNRKVCWTSFLFFIVEIIWVEVHLRQAVSFRRLLQHSLSKSDIFE